MKPNYLMYTEAGDEDVHKIVQVALALKLTWAETLPLLRRLALMPRRGDALDTSVRELVYEAIGADVRNEEFYIESLIDY
jgi:hypothetical protein